MAIKFPITSEPIYLAISRDRISLLASPTSPPERDSRSRFIASNYLLADRDKRVTSTSERFFPARKSRVTRGCRGKKRAAWVSLGIEEADVVTLYVLASPTRLAAAAAATRCLLPRLCSSQLPTRGPHVSTEYVSLFQFNVLPFSLPSFVRFGKNFTFSILMLFLSSFFLFLFYGRTCHRV